MDYIKDQLFAITLYDTLFEHKTVGVLLFDKDGVITKVNDKFIDLLGSSREKLIGFNIFKQVKNQEVIQGTQDALEVGFGEMYGEYTSVTGHTTSFVHILFLGIPASNGLFEQGIAIVQDLTALRKHKEKELLLTHFSIDNSNLAIFWIDAITGEISYANKLACESLGYSKEELTQLRVVDIDPNFDEEIWKEHSKKVFEAKQSRFETEHQRKDGTIFPVEIIAKILHFDDQVFNIAFVLDITERKKLQEELSLAKYSVEQATLGVFWTNESGEVLYANESGCNALDYTQEEIIQKKVWDIDPMMTPQRWTQEWVKLKVIRTSHFESLHKKKSGEIFPVEIFTNFLHTKNHGEILVGYVENISKQKQILQNLEKSEKLLRESQAIAKIGSWELNLSDNTLLWSDQVYTIFEIDKQSPIKNYDAFLEAIHPDDKDAVNEAYLKSLQDKKPYDIVHRLLINNKVKYVHEHCQTEFNKDGKPLRSIGTIKDVTKEHLLSKQLEFTTNYDALTNLPNRYLLNTKLQTTLEQLKDKNAIVGIVYIDIDNFKYVNDTYGHQLGDAVLLDYSKRIRSALENHGWLARFGGDGFVAVIEHGITKPSQIAIIAQQILELSFQELVYENANLRVTLSIGVSTYPHDATDADTLIKYADSAMHRAKEHGKNRFEFYTSDLTSKILKKMQLSSQLFQAIQNDEFELYYQPQIDLGTLKTVGVEALLRWNHPQLGVVSPIDFIPLAEENKSILALGQWVIENAFQQYHQWQKKGIFDGTLAINVSQVQIDEGYCPKIIKKYLKAYDINPSKIEIELTESSIMRDSKKSLKVLQKLSDLGLKLAIDDFGTGYSSLAYLRKMPVTTLKIDRSFIKDLPSDTDASTIVQTILSLCKNMNLQPLAEGVETREQLHFLKKAGCSSIQGYLFSKPLQAQEVEKFFDTELTRLI